MANNSNHIMNRYGKWITNKQRERLRKLYKGYRQSTAGDMRSQYLNARKGMYGVRTTASAYGLGEGYVARKKAQYDSSLTEAGRQYAAQADAAFENNAVRPAANATIQAENERKQKEYEEKLRKAREKAAKQAKAQADYERALEEYNRNKDKTDKENAKRLAEYKKAMAKYRKDLKNAKQRGEKLDRLPQRQVLHGGQPLPKGLSLSADLHQYEGATSTPKQLKPLPKGKGNGKANGRGGLLSDQMYEYESGTGHQPNATSHQGLNNRPVAPKTNYAANQAAVQNRKKAKEAAVGKPTKPILAITDAPIPVAPYVEKDLVAKIEATKPEEIPKLKNDYINSVVEHENLVGDLYNALKPDMNRVGLAQEFNHWVGVAQNTALSPAERKQAAMYASRAAEEYNLQDNGKAHKEQIATLTQMVNDSHEQLIQQQFLLQQKGVRMSEDEIGFDTGYLRQYGAIPAQASDATYAQAQALGDKNSDLGKQLRELAKMEYLHSQGLPSGQLSPQMQAFIEENNLGWLIDQEVLDRAPLVGIETAIEEKLKRGGDERTEYLQRKGIDRVQRELSTSNPEAIKRVIGSGDSITHLSNALKRGDDAFDKGNTAMMERVESYIQNNLGIPSDYINKNTINVLRKDEASVAFIDYCYATGQADLAKQFLFDLTEAANKAAGEKQADIISNLLPDGWKWIPEFMYHLGYGASNAIWGKIDFFRGKTPTRTGAYTQEGIIQNEIERWTDKLGKTRAENRARTWANALTSAGENFTDLAIGTLTKGALGAAGDAIGGTVGNIVGKVAGHAPGISMGWSAAGSAKQEMLKKGYSDKAATIYGIFSGVSEAVLQEQVGGLVGFGDRGAFTKALSGLVDQIPSAAGRTAINAVLDVASEIGQEEFGNILDSVYKSVVLGEGNDVYDDFKEQFNETAVTTAISTLLLNALHIPTQIRNERGYTAIADASGMSLNNARFLLETDAAIKRGDRVDPNDILRYNELTANLMASMPDNVVKSINEGRMTVADWATSNEGVVQGKLTGKLTEADTKTEAAKNPVTGAEIKAVDHTEALKGKTDEQRRDYLLNAAPTGKVGSAYYSTTDGKAIEFKNLNTTQKANYVLAQKCAKAFEGSVDVVIHDTLPLSNGAMVGSDGKLHIALDVTDNKGRESIAYWTLAHEAGHALKIADGKAWNEMFNVLTDYAKNHKDRDGKSLYDALVDSITNQYKYDNNSDAFNDEMFSLIAERMVGSEGEQWAATLGDNTIFDAIAADKNASAKAKRGFLGKLKTSVEKLLRQFRDGGFSKERKRLAKIREQLTEAYKRINEVPSIRDAAVARQVERKAQEDARKLREQTERREGFREGLKAHDAEFNKQKEAREKKARDDALLEEILKGFEEEDRIKASEMASNMSEDGEVIGDLEIDNDGNVNRFSIRTTPQTEEGWDSLVNDMVAAGYTEEQAKAWIDDMRSVAAEIMDAQEFLDYENDPRSSWFRKNAEYTQGTIDFSNNCPRRAEFTAQFDALMKQFPNFAFTAEDYETIRTIIKDAGIAVTCGGCYVEERRQHLSEIGQLFLDKYHAALNGETGDNALAKKFFDKISEEDKKYDITLDDIVSSDSLRKLYDEHPTLYKAFNNFNNARGMAAARLVYGLSEYNNQIKKWNKGTITRKNNLGGLRIFSYSDADPRIILDVMQIITDSASKGLMMQGYTKKPWFAVFMKNTGVRLLRSHIPMGTGYKMVKGQMVLDFDNFEGINTKDKYYSMLDRDTDLNIGNNVIGINDTQIRLAMVSDIIDQIIPFHTGLKKSILHQKKLEEWNNYRDYQTDKAWTAGDNGEYKWRTVKKGGINLYTDIINAIDWSKTETRADGSPMTDAERFVNKYLDICREKGFKPRFAQFLCDENGNELSDYGDDHFYIEQDGKKVANPDAWYTYNPGYEKFLVDFRLFDKNGKIIEQNAVAPNFDNEFVKSLFSEYIKENPQAKPMDKGVQTKIVDAMKEKYGDELDSTRHSLRAADPVTYDDNGDIIPLSERFNAGNEDIRYQHRGVDVDFGSAVVELSDDSELAKRIRTRGDRSPQAVINDFIRETFGGQTLMFSDGRKVIIDGGDAKKLSQHPKPIKTAEIAKLKELITTAKYSHSDLNAEHPKFKAFHYYIANVKYNRRILPVELDVGDASNDGSAHLYDIKNSTVASSGKNNSYGKGTASPDIAGILQKNDATNVTVPQPTPSVNPVSQEIPSAALTDDRISDLIKEYGASGNYAKAYVTSIDPRDFLRLTVSDDVLDKWNAAEGEHEEIFALDEDKLRSNRQTPYLNINHETGEVEGHEGRHRMRALWKAGITSVPIAIVDTANKYGKTVTDKMTVSSQDFGKGSVNGGYSVTLKNLVPTNEQYREQITRDYGGGAKVRYQDRDFRIDFNVPQLDTKALHEAVKGGEGTVENRFEVKYEKTDSGFAVHITDKDSGKTYDRAETVTEGNAKAEAERAAAAVIRNIKRGEQRKAFREYADKREADARLAERMHEGAKLARAKREADEEIDEAEAKYRAKIKRLKDEQKERIETINAEYDQKIDAIKEKLRAQYQKEVDSEIANRMHEGAIRERERQAAERKLAETKEHYEARIKKLREEKNERIEIVRQQYIERIKKENEERYRKSIKKTAMQTNKKLVDMLARPTENKHVPVQLARSVAEFCEEVTKYLDGTTKRGEKILDKIRKAYDRAFTDEQTILRAKSEDAGYDARGAVLNTSQKDEQLAEMLKELSEITAEKSFAELSRDEMDALLNVVRGVAHTVTEANKLIGEAEGKTVWQTGSTMIEQLENAPKVSSKLRGYLATSLDLRRLARIFSGSNEDAEFVKLVEQLNQGAIEKERVAQELQAIFKPVTDEYGDEIKKWYGRKAEWLDTGIVTKDGVPVKITKGMRVSLALHVLNEGNMRHIERGGLTIPEAKLYAQGKLADAYANSKPVRLTAEQINDIIANMTEAEKAYVEAAKQLFHDRAGFYVNKTSLQLAGYTKANVENYFPIHTDENFNMTDFASMVMNGSIEGQGFLQERKNASNPIYLEDITSVVNRQIRGVALYAGMAIPVRNFNAVMKTAVYEDENGNWVPRTTVKQTLAKTMGAYGAKVVEGFVEDASEMSQRVDVTPVERIAGKLATNYVKAVLLGNLKVAMKQVASYPTAAAVIPWRYLAKGLASANKNMMFYAPLGFGNARKTYLEKIGREFPLFKVRQAGNANEIASIANKPGMEQKLPALLGWITTMDVETVRNIGLAAEYMVQDQHPDYKIGSEEYKRAVADIFNSAVQQTQPNFTPLQRNAALRSKNPIVRSLTLFGTQRMQNGGIIIEAAYELKHSKGKSAKEIAAARRKLGRAVASQVTQNFLLLVATLAVDALRGRMKQWQDDDDELTPESIASKMGDTFLSNFLGSFLGGTEFYETISNMYKKANGQTTYDTEFSVPALDAIETIMSFGQSGIPNFVNYITGDHTDEEKMNKLKSFSVELAKVTGYATGLPLENAVKDVFKGFIPAYKDIRDWRKTGELIPYLWQSGKLDSKKTRERYEAWIDSGHKGSAFFAIDKLLKGVGKRDDRAEILREQANLSPEDMALLMEMYDTSEGYANGTGFYNKNDKLLYDFSETPVEDAAPASADAESEPAAEQTSPAEDATAPAAVPAPTAAPAAQPTAEATTQPKSDKYTKAAEKWAQYGVTQTQAKSAVEKWEQTGNASEYRAWLSKQNYTGRQKFAMYAQANADTEKKAVDFNKKYGTKFEALWNAYAKYDSNSFHGEDYRAWVEKQTNDYRQRFSLVEFAEPRSNWIEHAEELHKAGVSYKAVWEAARYAKNQSGQGKKDRIIAYAKKLGMTSKQAENIYKWFG